MIKQCGGKSMAVLDFIYKRISIREFKDNEISIEDIKEIIKAATYAPSGYNLQNWHFVIIKDRVVIKELVNIVEKKHKEILENAKDISKKERFSKYLRFQTAFREAPVVILVYAGEYRLMEKEILLGLDNLKAEETIRKVEFASPGIQSVSAAIENLLLAAANLGYGTCWITSCNFAISEIEQYINLGKEGYYLVATIALGIPKETTITRPPRKSIEQVITII